MTDNVHCASLWDIRETRDANLTYEIPSQSNTKVYPNHNESNPGAALKSQSGGPVESLTGKPHFTRNGIDNIEKIQDVSLSPSSGLNTESRSASEHPTPSTMSQKDSSNTSSYSPNNLNVDSISSNIPGSIPNNITLPFNLAKDTSQPPYSCYPNDDPWDFGNFDPTMAPKAGQTGWTPQPSGEGTSQFGTTIEEMAWNDWVAASSAQKPQ